MTGAKLTHGQVVRALDEAEKIYRAIDDSFESMRPAFGCLGESPLYEASYRALDRYLDLLAEKLGHVKLDDYGYHWLSWHCYENKWGRKGMQAKEAHMPARTPIRSNADLAELLGFPAGKRKEKRP